MTLRLSYPTYKLRALCWVLRCFGGPPAKANPESGPAIESFVAAAAKATGSLMSTESGTELTQYQKEVALENSGTSFRAQRFRCTVALPPC